MLERLLEAVVDGVTSGAAYGLVAMGLVLVFKISRTINLTQGEIGTLAAYVTYIVAVQAHLPYGLAVALGLITGMATALVLERLVIWPLRNAPRVVPLVATGSLAISFVAAEVLVTKNTVQVLPPIVHGGGFTVAGVTVGGSQLLILAVAAAVALGGGLFFKRTMLGTAIRAAADEPVGAQAMGLPLARISMLVWIIAGLLAAVAGVLLAPAETISPGFVTQNVLIDALAAMVIGGMTSLSGAFLGGIIVGVGESIAFTEIPSAIPGASALIVLVLLLATLLIRPRGLLGHAV